MSSARTAAVFLGTAAALGAWVVVACSSFGADAPVVASDGAPDDSPGTTADGSSDAGHEDGAPGAPDAAGPFCPAHVSDPGFLYCNDFELPTQALTPYGFTRAELSPGISTVTIKADGERTSVLEAKVDSTSADAAADHSVWLTQSLGAPGLPPALSVEYDLEIITDNSPSATLADIHMAGFGCEASAGLGTADGQTSDPKVTGTRAYGPTLISYPQAEWRHVITTFTPDPTDSKHYREVTTYGGKPLVDRLVAGGADLVNCSNQDLRIGIGELSAASVVIIVRFDNILVRKL